MFFESFSWLLLEDSGASGSMTKAAQTREWQLKGNQGGFNGQQQSQAGPFGGGSLNGLPSVAGGIGGAGGGMQGAMKGAGKGGGAECMQQIILAALQSASGGAASGAQMSNYGQMRMSFREDEAVDCRPPELAGITALIDDPSSDTLMLHVHQKRKGYIKAIQSGRFVPVFIPMQEGEEAYDIANLIESAISADADLEILKEIAAKWKQVTLSYGLKLPECPAKSVERLQEVKKFEAVKEVRMDAGDDEDMPSEAGSSSSTKRVEDFMAKFLETQAKQVENEQMVKEKHELALREMQNRMHIQQQEFADWYAGSCAEC